MLSLAELLVPIFLLHLLTSRNPVSENLSYILTLPSHFERRVSVATFAQFPGLFSTILVYAYIHCTALPVHLAVHDNAVGGVVCNDHSGLCVENGGMFLFDSVGRCEDSSFFQFVQRFKLT
jgi:hypothetical protein